MSWIYDTEQIDVDTNGESLYSAGSKINTFFRQLSGEWTSFISQYTDAKASQTIQVPFDKLETTVYEYLSSTYSFDAIDTGTGPAIIRDKMDQLPDDWYERLSKTNWSPKMFQQQVGRGDAPRAVFFDGTIGMWRFANNEIMSQTFADFTAMLGNVYYEEGVVELVMNGVVYNYGDQAWSPGATYYLTDLMDGWLVPYQEGGEGRTVSIPMLVSVHPHAGILLSHRGITKDLPCVPTCPPKYLNWLKDRKIYSTPVEADCDNVLLHIYSNGSSQQTNIIDFSNYSRSLTYDKTYTYNDISNKKYGVSSVRFDGNLNAGIETNNTSSYNFEDNNFTIEFLVQFDDQSRNDFLLGAFDSDSLNTGWFVSSPSNQAGITNGLKFVSIVDGDIKLSHGIKYAFSNAKWYHVVLSRVGTDEEDWKRIIDDEVITKYRTSGRWSASLPPAVNGKFRIGSPKIPSRVSNINTTSLTGTHQGDYTNITVDDFYTLKLEGAPGSVKWELSEQLENILGIKIRFKGMSAPPGGEIHSSSDRLTVLVNNQIVIDYTKKSTDPDLMTILDTFIPMSVNTVQIIIQGGVDIEYIEFSTLTGVVDMYEFKSIVEDDMVPLLGNLDDIRITNGQALYINNFFPLDTNLPTCYSGCELMLTIDKPVGLCEYTPLSSDVVAIYDECGHTGGNNNLPESESDIYRFPPVMNISDAVMALAEAEGLIAHRNAISLRLNK